MKRYPYFNRKGFTLAELLIVVAIIAVLVAIAIPIFRKNLEKSREAYDIYTMRQAASAAIELYYAGVKDSASATAAGLSWSDIGNKNQNNAYGAYHPNGKIYKDRPTLSEYINRYGKGTSLNGGTEYVVGGRKAYAPNLDYTNAVVMVSIYPNADKPHVDVYWKNNVGSSTYVGGDEGGTDGKNIPKYSLRIYLN